MSSDEPTTERIMAATAGFELMLVGLEKSRVKGSPNDYMMTCRISGTDIPNMLLRDPLGSRYMVAFTRLNDMNEPEPRADDVEMQRAVASAGLLCKEDDFLEWLAGNEYISEPVEEEAAEWLRQYLGISSRSEIGTDPEVYEKFISVRDDYFSARRKRK